MTFSVFVAFYLTFCLIVAFLGRKVSIGFWGVLIMSIFLTPLLTAIFIVLFRPKAKKKEDVLNKID